MRHLVSTMRQSFEWTKHLIPCGLSQYHIELDTFLHCRVKEANRSEAFFRQNNIRFFKPRMLFLALEIIFGKIIKALGTIEALNSR